MSVPVHFTPPASCPRPHHCSESRFCQELRPCHGECWAARHPQTERERLAEYLDRQGIPHNLNEEQSK